MSDSNKTNISEANISEANIIEYIKNFINGVIVKEQIIKLQLNVMIILWKQLLHTKMKFRNLITIIIIKRLYYYRFLNICLHLYKKILFKIILIVQ